MKSVQKLIVLLIAFFVCEATTAPLSSGQTAQVSTYLIGTYAHQNKQGIELLSLDQGNLLLSAKVVADGIKDPTFVIANRAGTLIFTVESTPDGKLKTYAFSQDRQSLEPLDEISSYGDHPCYIALDDSERLVAVANYESGSFSVYETDSKGGLHFKQSVQHAGNSINRQRQNTAHVHSMVFHPNGKQLLVADLGTDKIYIYDLDYASDKPVTPANPAYFSVAAGAGPRHMVIHPNGKLLYLVHELSGEIGVYLYESRKIRHIKTYSLTTTQFKGQAQAAEIRLSPDARFVYVSNRGDANNLSVFETDLQGGLRLIQQISTDGRTPRNFSLSPDGHFLLVANQDSDDIRLFKRDLATGRLSKTAARIEIRSPAYIFPLH